MWETQVNPYINNMMSTLYQTEFIRMLYQESNAEEQESKEQDANSIKDNQIQESIIGVADGLELNDYFASFGELSEKHGYSHECHDIHTSDGYILSLFRIQPRQSAQFEDDQIAQASNDFKNAFNLKPKKPVVFMQHGLLASADSWIINEDSMSPAFRLAELGYDVWLGN